MNNNLILAAVMALSGQSCPSCCVDIDSELEKLPDTACGMAASAFYRSDCGWKTDGKFLYPDEFVSECEGYWDWIETEAEGIHKDRCTESMGLWLSCLQNFQSGYECNSCNDEYETFLGC